MNTATENLAARETFLADVVVTAVEGGIRSWATVDEYHWYHPDIEGGTAEPAPHGGGNAWATLYLDEDEDLAIGLTWLWDLTPRVIASAFRELMREDYQPSDGRDIGGETWVETPVGQGFLPSIPWRDRVLRARRENDAGELDAADADMLVQLGVFGGVVFG